MSRRPPAAPSPRETSPSINAPIEGDTKSLNATLKNLIMPSNATTSAPMPAERYAHFWFVNQ